MVSHDYIRLCSRWGNEAGSVRPEKISNGQDVRRHTVRLMHIGMGVSMLTCMLYCAYHLFTVPGEICTIGIERLTHTITPYMINVDEYSTRI